MAWRSGRSYSADLRGRVLAAVDDGEAVRVVAERFRVSISFIYKALARRRATGETSARAQCNHQKLKLADFHDAIAEEITKRPDVTLEELRRWLRDVHQIEASMGLMHKTMVRLGLTLKKSRAVPRSSSATMSPNSEPNGEPGNPR